MEEDLIKVSNVAGVRYAFICDKNGEVIARTMPSNLDEATFNSIGREISLVMADLEKAGEAMSELDFFYQKARLVARDLTNAVLVVLCDPLIEIAMLRLTLNVVTARVIGDSTLQSQFKARVVDEGVAKTQ